MWDYPRLFSYKVEYSDTNNGKDTFHNIKGVVVATSFKEALDRVYNEYDPKIVPYDKYELYSIAVDEQDDTCHFIQEIEDETEEW